MAPPQLPARRIARSSGGTPAGSPPLRGLEDAWAALRALYNRRAAPSEQVAGLDAALAVFIAEHPGELEGLVQERAAALLEHGEPGDSLLTWLVELHGESRWENPLPQTLLQVDPAAWLRFFATVRRELLLELGFSTHNMVQAAAWFAERGGDAALEAAGFTPEWEELVRCTVEKAELKPVLPLEELAGWDEAAVVAALEAYQGVPIKVFEARLRATPHFSSSGFLGDGERVAAVILEDARALAQLGVRAADIAHRLRVSCMVHWHNRRVQEAARYERPPGGATLASAPRGDSAVRRARELASLLGPPNQADGRYALAWQCELHSYLGYVFDPLHSSDAYHLHGQGASDFFITGASGEKLRGSTLTIELIRRACFFEGRVDYRIDPIRAARVLGLHPDAPSAILAATAPRDDVEPR